MSDNIILDMTFELALKSPSAISVIDPFHFKPALSDTQSDDGTINPAIALSDTQTDDGTINPAIALSDTQNDDGTINPAIESEIQYTVAAIPKFTFSDETLVCVEQAADTSINPSSYITAFAYDDGECTTHSDSMKSAGTDSLEFSTDKSPSLRNNKRGYIEALVYTSNETINNVEQQNDTSVSPSNISDADNHTIKDVGYILLSDLPPVVQSRNSPSTQNTKDGYVDMSELI